jgi:hypothetical protein
MLSKLSLAMHKSGGRQPAVIRYRTGNTERFLPNEDARMPRGAYAPPALGGSAVRTFAGETATCALHERSLTRAANVSPP